MRVNWNAVEREERDLEEQYGRGEITLQQYHAAIRELRDDVRGVAEEAARDAYNDALGDW